MMCDNYASFGTIQRHRCALCFISYFIDTAVVIFYAIVTVNAPL